jgi:pSer/pThr/pTyr-binding forkhead associated (FHA) protein
MKARLIERSGKSDDAHEIALNQSEFLIGRGPDCDLRLRVPSVSRHHCLVRVGTDEVSITDLGSSNGTFLNGKRVRSQASLHTGDELQMGECRYVVDLGDQDAIDFGASTGADPFTSTIKLSRPKPSGDAK